MGSKLSSIRLPSMSGPSSLSGSNTMEESTFSSGSNSSTVIRKILHCAQPTWVLLRHDFIVLEAVDGQEMKFYSLEKVNERGGSTLRVFQGPSLVHVFQSAGYGGVTREKPRVLHEKDIVDADLNLDVFMNTVTQSLDRPWRLNDNCQHFAKDVFKIATFGEAFLKRDEAKKVPCTSPDDVEDTKTEVLPLADSQAPAKTVVDVDCGILQEVVHLDRDEWYMLDTLDENEPPLDADAARLFTETVVLTFSKFLPARDEKFLNSVELQESFQALNKAGLEYKSSRGATVLVPPSIYHSVSHEVVAQSLGPRHVVVIAVLQEIVARIICEGADDMTLLESRPLTFFIGE